MGVFANRCMTSGVQISETKASIVRKCVEGLARIVTVRSQFNAWFTWSSKLYALSSEVGNEVH